MKKVLLWAMVLGGIVFGSCAKSEEGDEDKLGSIYGIVTKLGTAEPMKAVGVELYKKEDSYSSEYTMLLLKTVTFDDGHFEFKDLNPNSYQVKVVADGYEQTEEGYVTVEAGRQARIDLQVKKQDVHAKAYTANAVVSGTRVTLSGEYTKENGYSVFEAGFVYATNNNPQNGGTKVKCKNDEIKEVNLAYKMSTTVSNMPRGTYYYQAYATTENGTAYGEILSFKISVFPTVKTLAVTNVLAETATLNGLIESEGDPAYTERGFVYSKSYNIPTVQDPANATTKVPVSGRNVSFSANVSSLTENATYYVRAYATNEEGTFYGEVKTFNPTAILPTVTTLAVTNILQTGATLNGRIDNAGEPAYTERGFVYSSSYKIPAIGDPPTVTTKVIVDGTSKEFNANVSSLKEGYTYYVRAYAISSKGTSYGKVQTFKPGPPEYITIDNLMIQSSDLGKVDRNTAYTMCENSRIGGFSDWRLPTLAELSWIYTERNNIPNLKTTNGSCYWSSGYHPYNTYKYDYIDFCTGLNDATTQGVCYVRAVRTVK